MCRCILSLSLALIATSLDAAPSTVTVVTPSLGTVKGVSDNGVDVFKGMKYGVPFPRWEKATPYTRTDNNSIVDATNYGASCWQTDSGQGAMDEDCLFLNIWRPAGGSTDTTLKAIMFYVHGGGFVTGSGADMLFESTDLARQTGNIVVTVNYRLGPLGFLVTDESGAGGMNGLSDMVLALEWLQKNAEAFGGDPSNVMIFGESAGGCASCVLSVSKAAVGLIKSAIIESGPCVGGWQPEPREQGLALTALLFKKLNVSTIDELRGVPAEAFTWPTSTGGYFLDDGAVMPVQPSELFARGDLVVESIMMGGNSYDTTIELMPAPVFPGVNGTSEDYRRSLEIVFGFGNAAKIQAQYPMSRFNGSASAALVQANSDAIVTCPTLNIANWLASSNSNVGDASSGGRRAIYSYRYAHLQQGCDPARAVVPAVPDGMDDWASHGSELFLVFNSTAYVNPLNVTEIVRCALDEEEKALSASIMALWGSFAASGVPFDKTPASVNWPAYDAVPGAYGQTLLFAIPDSGAVASLKAEDCKFWRDLHGESQSGGPWPRQSHRVSY